MPRDKHLPGHYHTETEGVIALQVVVQKTGWVWRAGQHPDVGVDGEIEPAEDNVPSGHILKAQVKSGATFFKRENNQRFALPVDEKDITYWRRLTTPLVVAVYNPVTKQLFAIEFHRHFAEHPEIAIDRLIWFDKQTDTLTPDRLRLLAGTAAVPSPPTTAPARRSEYLHANLLPITEEPRWLYHIGSDIRTSDELSTCVGQALARRLIVWKGEIWTFDDLYDHEAELSPFTGTALPERSDCDRWRTSPADVPRYHALLYAYLGMHFESLGLRSAKPRYFFPSIGGENRSLSFQSMKRRSSREVASCVMNSTGSCVRHWRHRAITPLFSCVGRSRLLSLQTGWCFTRDGVSQVLRPPKGLVTRLTYRERNEAVFRLLMFWAEILSQGAESIVVPCGGQQLIMNKHFATAEAAFGIANDFVDLHRESSVAEEPLPIVSDDEFEFDTAEEGSDRDE